MEKIILTYLNKLKQNKIEIGLFYFMVTLIGCNQSVADKMLNTLDQECTFEEFCSFDLSIATGFEWDTVYIFREYFSDEEISRTTGIEWAGSEVGDGNQRLVFIKDNKIVYVEDFDSYTTNVQFRTMIWIAGSPANEPIKYSKKETVFTVVMKKSNSRKRGYFFDLYPLDGTLKPQK
jgi:hypothetical protein